MQNATRPLPVTLIACLYIVTGLVGSAAHLIGLHGFESDALWAVLVNLIALIGGVWMLQQQNWARWLAVAWMAFHVILSVFHSPREFIIHALFLVAIAFFLFRPRVNAWFAYMQSATRPLPVTLIACLYIVTGIAGSAAHLIDLHVFETDVLWAIIVNLIALIGGVWLLRRQNWARWLAVAWMAFHVILSIFHSPRELVIHALFLVAIAFFLFRPRVSVWFAQRLIM